MCKEFLGGGSREYSEGMESEQRRGRACENVALGGSAVVARAHSSGELLRGV